MAAAVDVTTLRIPNWLPALVSAFFVLAAAVEGMALADAALHTAVALGLFATGFFLFAKNLMGAGDAKLLAAAGLWLGPAALLPFLVFSVVAGGVMAAAMAVHFMLDVEANLRRSRAADIFRSFQPQVPYGYAFAVGAILALPWSWWMNVAAASP